MNFIITDIVSVRKTDEKKYKNGFVEYSPNLISNEIIYRPNGYSTVNFDGKVLKTTPNSVHILPFKNGGKYTAEYDEPDYFIDIFFLTDRPFFTEPVIINNIQSSRLNSLFNKAFSSYIKRDAGYKFECISLLYKIFAELEKKNYIPESNFLKIKPAVKYIEEKFLTENISCEHLAELCGISYSYFQRIFSQKYGISPKRYIIQLKVNYASDLLKSGEYSVSQTAEMSGFDDLYFFSRQFKEYVGMSPQKYKNNPPK
ncbi:MAG: helix-turn-helix transcriptional regulator [Ruminococcaceae bacterium]|nr:helix-turn-helix transcriptional regulator [Oscillospiraceae bacterium]